MRLVNIWSLSPDDSWTLIKNVRQLTEESLDITPLGKRFSAANGVQIYYSSGASERKITLRFEVTGAAELRRFFQVLKNGTAYMENLMISGYDNSSHSDSILVYVDGSASVQQILRNRELYQITVPVVLDSVEHVMRFPTCYIIANPAGGHGVSIVRSSDDTGTGTLLLLDNGKQLEDGSVLLPSYTANAEEMIRKSVYIRFWANYTFPEEGAKLSVTADGVNGQQEQHDITEYVTGKYGTIGMALTGVTTEFRIYLHYTYANQKLDRTYRIRVDAPNFQEDEK